MNDKYIYSKDILLKGKISKYKVVDETETYYLVASKYTNGQMRLDKNRIISGYIIRDSDTYITEHLMRLKEIYSENLKTLDKLLKSKEWSSSDLLAIQSRNEEAVEWAQDCINICKELDNDKTGI
jgi:hypothetical protein